MSFLPLVCFRYGWDENTFLTFLGNKTFDEKCMDFRKISSIFREKFL
jgi:hypothetical protein